MPPPATGFSEYFPGIKPHLLTLETNFRTPFYRDILMWMGVCSVSKESCQNILGQGGGSAITIVVGGAAESLSAHPGTADLTLRKRYESCRPVNLPLSLWPSTSGSGSSRLPFERGTSRGVANVELGRLISSQGRLGACILIWRERRECLDLPRSGFMAVKGPADIPTNAEPKGNHYTRAAEEVSKRLRLYPAPIPWTWAVELYVQRTFFVVRKRFH